MPHLEDEVLKRFVSKFTRLDQWDGCWRWHGAKVRGYGSFRLPGNPAAQYAHRVAYEHARGPIPEGKSLHHVCGNRWCVNPAHLKPVTNAEHGLLHAGAATHCPQGHPYSPENTYLISTRPGARVCKTCALARQKAARDSMPTEARERLAAHRRQRRANRTPEQRARDSANKKRWKQT